MTFDFNRGQQFASQVQSASPELFDNLRRQMGGGNGPNNPDPSQQN